MHRTLMNVTRERPAGSARRHFSRPARTAVLLCLALWAVVPPAAAGPLQDDVKARRTRLIERLGPDAIAIFFSAPSRVFSTDVNYEYRQESNLLYLTAIDQEDTILVLMPGNETRKEIVFVRDADPRREHWNGHSLTASEATAQSGIQTVMTVSQFEPFIASVFSKRTLAGAPSGTEYTRFFKALNEGRAKLAVLIEPRFDLSAPAGPVMEFAAKLRERFVGFSLQDATPALTALRQVKTSYEQDVLRKSVQISSEAHRAGMRAAAPGKYEYEVEAEIEAVYLRRGAMSWGYPSIVGSGPNATILHYQKSTRKMAPGDLLLVDAAGNYQGLTGDITRTYPVNGTYSREQRDIYEIVFAAQQAGEKAARVGGAPREIQAACDEVLRAGLVRLGLVTEPAGTQFKIWATHGVSHGIGMDVHDPGTPGLALAAGMAFTIEPGIYIREVALDELPKTSANAAFIEKIRPLVRKYRDIGVRIEDSYLLTPTGLERLSSGVPRTIDEIEGFMKQPGSARR
ncbi:MAG: aminopeptidase P N-terminal domain-containing protein [Acidobacteriota bacterium]